MVQTDIIFSINVHEKKDFLIKQIKNINDQVSLNYIIVINPNKHMYNEISNCEFIKSKENIILNKNYLEKSRMHGSLTKGIYLNMEYAINNYEFKYFIILSSRNMFYNKLTNKNYNTLVKDGNISEGHRCWTYEQLNVKEWHWPSFLKTKLSKYIINKKWLFSGGAHEGLTFDYISCKNIINFLNNNNDIRTNLFNWNKCVEEFALQTICINLTGYYYYIGNGVGTTKPHEIQKLPKNKFVYKTNRI
tara:strand:- start:6714 stop:7454 length:741 start_codon:yes stop_codon:yes gene_type:complete